MACLGMSLGVVWSGRSLGMASPDMVSRLVWQGSVGRLAWYAKVWYVARTGFARSGLSQGMA